jgi:hypothetical protein
MVDKRLKEKIDPCLKITPRSTPVIWFGNYDKSIVCTISLNPSDKEFYKQPKKQKEYVRPENLLKGDEERLCSRDLLNKNDNEQLSDDDIKIVKNYCNNYFKNKNYYREWFDSLNDFLIEFGNYSYFDDSCVHLDIVQWATTPKWDGIDFDIKQKHLNNDLKIIKYLIDNKDFKIIFLNGRSVLDIISEYLMINLDKKNILYKNINDEERNINIYTGIYNNTKIIGWNKYFQRAFKNKDNIKIFSDLIKRNI